MKLYYYVTDHGDGSSSVRWCEEQYYVDLLEALDEDEALYMNEGTANHLVLPDGTDLESLGISKYRMFKPKE